MAKRTSNRSTADDAGAAPAQPRNRRPRAASAPPTGPDAAVATAARADDEGAAPHAASANNPAGIPSEAGDDAPLEQIGSSSMSSEPSEEDIRVRAYHRYLERGAGQGSDFEDWLEAERELRQR